MAKESLAVPTKETVCGKELIDLHAARLAALEGRLNVIERGAKSQSCRLATTTRGCTSETTATMADVMSLRGEIAALNDRVGSVTDKVHLEATIRAEQNRRIEERFTACSGVPANATFSRIGSPGASGDREAIRQNRIVPGSSGFTAPMSPRSQAAPSSARAQATVVMSASPPPGGRVLSLTQASQPQQRIRHASPLTPRTAVYR